MISVMTSIMIFTMVNITIMISNVVICITPFQGQPLNSPYIVVLSEMDFFIITHCRYYFHYICSFNNIFFIILYFNNDQNIFFSCIFISFIQIKNPRSQNFKGFTLARHAGFEPATFAFVVRYSIQLS